MGAQIILREKGKLTKENNDKPDDIYIGRKNNYIINIYELLHHIITDTRQIEYNEQLN
jgi:hypothetical protein